MEFEQVYSELSKRSGLIILKDVALSQHTSFGIGGPASFFASVHSAAEAARLLAVSRSLDIPALVLGGGTNLLVSDDGFEGLAIRTHFDGIQMAPDGRSVRVGATVPSAVFVETLVSAGIAGFEFAAGLPGSVGGAVAGNAGCFGATFGERLICATIVDAAGNTRVEDDPTWFDFDYRRSRLQAGGAIVVDVTLATSPGDKEALRCIADGHLETRHTKHPSKGIKTAGSYFKNLPPLSADGWRQPAGALLDQVGARDVSVGDAAVFEKHANILINRAHATARDMLRLEAILKQRVFERFGVTLEPEVRFAGNRPII